MIDVKWDETIQQPFNGFASNNYEYFNSGIVYDQSSIQSNTQETQLNATYTMVDSSNLCQTYRGINQLGYGLVENDQSQFNQQIVDNYDIQGEYPSSGEPTGPLCNQYQQIPNICVNEPIYIQNFSQQQQIETNTYVNFIDSNQYGQYQLLTELGNNGNSG